MDTILHPQAKAKLLRYLIAGFFFLVVSALIGHVGTVILGILAALTHFKVTDKLVAKIQPEFSIDDYLIRISLTRQKLIAWMAIGAAIVGTMTWLNDRHNQDLARQRALAEEERVTRLAKSWAEEQKRKNSKYGRFMDSCVGLVAATPQASEAGEICRAQAMRAGISPD